MKIYYIILSFFIINGMNAQCVFEYEKEINDTINYTYEEIDFLNEQDEITLKGTLISPKEPYDKLVIIVPGSGKDTRNSHFVLAEQYLKNGIGVYRFDERGIGKSKGKYDYKATTLASDLEYCHRHLKGKKTLIDKKIGVLGHSLGGLASLISYTNGIDYDFVILLGTPVEKDGAFIKYQAECNSDGFYAVEGKTKEEVVDFVGNMIDVVVDNEGEKNIKKSAKKLMKDIGFKKGLHLVINPLQIDLIKLNHEKALMEFDKPMLYLIGSEDRIVSSDRETEVLKGFNNKNIRIKVIENTNHWLSSKLNPSRMELDLYEMKESAMNEIINWTLELN